MVDGVNRLHVVLMALIEGVFVLGACNGYMDGKALAQIAFALPCFYKFCLQVDDVASPACALRKVE